MTHGLQLETRRGGEGEQCDLQKTGFFFFLEWRGKEWQLYLENQQTEKMVDKYPKEPSCPGLNANFLYKTKRGR